MNLTSRLITLIIFCLFLDLSGQDLQYTRKVIDNLSSPTMNGRGYADKDTFQTLVDINTEKTYLKQINKSGEAAISDHYPFYFHNVPSFFIYTPIDESKEYHNIYDALKNFHFTEYKNLFRLMADFVGSFNDQKS